MNEMESERKARRVWTACFIFWLCVVWGHSLMAGDLSSAESSRFVFLVRPLFALFGIADESVMTFAIRKTAHFLEYTILMALGTKMSVVWLGKTRGAWFLRLGIWVLAPVIDECIQLFVPGRAGMPTDVLIDMCGGALGMLITTLLMARKV